MTHAGVEVQNFATGETENISSRSDDSNISEQPVSTAGKILDHLDRSHIHRTSKKAVKKASKTAKQGIEAIRRPSSRLQFADEGRATPELQKTIHKSDKTADKLDMAQGDIPKKKKPVRKRASDEIVGTGKVHLHFKETEKLLADKVWHTPLPWPVQEVSRKLHGKIREVRKENAGVEGDHAVEKLGEKVVGRGYRSVKSGICHHRLKPHRAAVKVKQPVVKADADSLYQGVFRGNPQFVTSNPLSRFLQERYIRQSYAKQIQDAGKTIKNAGGVVKSVVTKTKEAVEKAIKSIVRNWKAVLMLLTSRLFIIFLLGALQPCSPIFGGASSSIIATSYLSEDSDVLAAEMAYSAVEAEFQYELDNLENLRPGRDEYCYDPDEIGHDPYVLISILLALHEGASAISETQGGLEMLLEKQYVLTLTEEVEVCYRTETNTQTDDEGNIRMDTYETPYSYYILNVELENLNLSHTPVHIMGEGILGLCVAYMSALDNRPDLSPTRAYPNASILKEPTCYDIPAEVLIGETFTVLITEAEKHLGFPYVWSGSNPRTSFDCFGFVPWALTNSDVCNTGRLGAQGSYSISTSVSFVDTKPGDLIFFVGICDTPGVSHVGIYAGSGMMLYCGNPISYTNIDTSY